MKPPPLRPCLLNLCVASIKPPPAALTRPPVADGFLPLKSFLFTPDGSFILPAQILLAYALAYAEGIP